MLSDFMKLGGRGNMVPHNHVHKRQYGLALCVGPGAFRVGVRMEACGFGHCLQHRVLVRTMCSLQASLHSIKADKVTTVARIVNPNPIR